MIRFEEVEKTGDGWVRSQDHTGQPSFRYEEGGRRVEIGMTDDLRRLRDGRQVAGYCRPWVALHLTGVNRGTLDDRTEAEALRLLKGSGREALAHFADDFAAGEAAARKSAGESPAITSASGAADFQEVVETIARGHLMREDEGFFRTGPENYCRAAALSAEQEFVASVFGKIGAEGANHPRQEGG